MKEAAIVLLLALLPLASAAGAELVLRDPDLGGCAEVRGTHVAYVVSGDGIVLLASRPFPGGQEVGSVRAGALDAGIAGLGRVTLSIEAADGTAIWGLFDRSLDVGSSRGCFGFGPRRFSDIDDLKTYLHWWVRQVLDRLPVREGPPPAVWLAGRSVSIEILSPGHRSLVIRGTEGTTLGFEPEQSPRRFYFQPFVIGRAASTVAVRVSVKEGDYFGPGVAPQVAFVLIGPDEPTPLATEPPLALRLHDLHARVEFDR